MEQNKRNRRQDMRVKTFYATDTESLDEMINDYIRQRQSDPSIQIKFSIASDEFDNHFSAMVIATW